MTVVKLQAPSMWPCPDVVAMLAKLQESGAMVVGVVQRPASAWDRGSADARSKKGVRAASAATAAEAAVDREAKFHLHSTLQVMHLRACACSEGLRHQMYAQSGEGCSSAAQLSEGGFTAQRQKGGHMPPELRPPDSLMTLSSPLQLIIVYGRLSADGMGRESLLL